MSGLSRRQGSDEGIALVVALLVTAIAFLVVTAVLTQSVHNVLQSGYARRRLAAINAAEAGLNWYANLAATSNPIALSTIQWTHDSSGWYSYTGGVATTAPETATFEVRAIYSSNSPCKSSASTPALCAFNDWFKAGKLTLETLKPDEFPDSIYAIVRSIGRVGWVGSKTSSGSVSRALESYVRLRAQRNGLSSGLMSTSVCLSAAAQVTVEGDLSVNNEVEFPSGFDSSCKSGDIVMDTGDSLTLKAVPGNPDKGGSLTVRGGGLKVTNNATLNVAQDIWAEKAVAIGAGGTTASGCTVSTVMQCVGDDVIAPSVTLGPKAVVLGEVIKCETPCPPPSGFPELKWRLSDWSAAWDPKALPDTSMTGATGLVQKINGVSIPTVFYYFTSAPPCSFDFANQSITLLTRVAVVSNCRYIFKSAGTSIAGGADSALLLISAAPDTGLLNAACTGTSTSPGPQDIEISNNQSFTAAVFLYTPCVLWLQNNQDQSTYVKGQFVARFMWMKNKVILQQNDISQFVTTIPGQISNFLQDVKFVREISPEAALKLV